MSFYDDLDRVRRELDDYEQGARSLERQLDRTDQDNFNLRRELEEERLERVRLEGEGLELVAEVQRLRAEVQQLQGLLRAEGMNGWEEEESQTQRPVVPITPDGNWTLGGVVPVCIGCNKHPSQLSEYGPEMTGEDHLTPVQYVQRNEGTYNYANGHFLCTPCYIKAGSPTSPGGWKAP